MDTINDEQHEPKTAYAIGYELGKLCDMRSYAYEITRLHATNADAVELAEFNEGWEHGTLDSYLDALRVDMRLIEQPSRTYAMAAISNLVFALKTKGANHG